METKNDILLFNKKEVSVIIVLLALVAIFSFTLGIKLGQKLNNSKVDVDQSHTEAPLSAVEQETEHEVDAHAAPITAKEKHEQDQAAVEEAIEKAKQSLDHEVQALKAGSGKAVPMSFPNEKKEEQYKNNKVHSTTGHAEKNPTKLAAGKYTLQVGSHRTIEEANAQVKELRDKGFDSFYLGVEIPGKGTWYRVGIGMYPTKEMAESSANNLKKTKEMPTFIIQKMGE